MIERDKQKKMVYVQDQKIDATRSFIAVRVKRYFTGDSSASSSFYLTKCFKKEFGSALKSFRR